MFIKKSQTNIPETAEEVIPSEPRKSKERVLGALLLGSLIIIVCFGLFGAGWGAFILWKSQSVARQAPSIETIAKGGSEVEQVMEPVEASGELTEGTEETQSSVGAATLDVIVMNGGGTKGIATEASEFLKKEGFTKTSVGNTTGNFSGTVVYYKKGEEASAKLVEEKLKSKYSGVTTKEALSDNKETQTATVTVIFGK